MTGGEREPGRLVIIKVLMGGSRRGTGPARYEHSGTGMPRVVLFGGLPFGEGDSNEEENMHN